MIPIIPFAKRRAMSKMEGRDAPPLTLHGITVLRALALGAAMSESDVPGELRRLGMVHATGITPTEIGRAWIRNHDMRAWEAVKDHLWLRRIRRG